MSWPVHYSDEKEVDGVIYYTRPKAAEYANIYPTSLEKWVKYGHIRSYQFDDELMSNGRKVHYYRKEDLDRNKERNAKRRATAVKKYEKRTLKKHTKKRECFDNTFGDIDTFVDVVAPVTDITEVQPGSISKKEAKLKLEKAGMRQENIELVLDVLFSPVWEDEPEYVKKEGRHDEKRTTSTSRRPGKRRTIQR